MSSVFKSLKIPTVIVICIVLLLLLSGCDNEQPQPAFTTNATEFIAEFLDNSLDFEAKYKDILIQLSGKIAIIGEVAGIPIVDISSEESELYSVYAYFESDPLPLLNLAKGQYITVQGIYIEEGFFTLELHNCTIIN